MTKHQIYTNLTVTVKKTKLYNIHHNQISDMPETLLKNGAVIYFFDPVVVVLGLPPHALVSLPKVRARCKKSKLRRFK